MHSLGGLVTQYALNLSNCSPEVDIQSIEKYTVGLAFLGTPHHGSDYAGWLSFATSLTGCLKQINQEIIACLKPQSEVLAMIQKGFHTLLSKRNDAGSKIAVTCFPEQLPVTWVGHVSLSYLIFFASSLYNRSCLTIQQSFLNTHRTEFGLITW
jgi:hypothetical protein